MVEADGLFPHLPFPQWVSLWRLGYTNGDDAVDDAGYTEPLSALRSAQQFDEVQSALRRLFMWKDRLANRWQGQLDTLTPETWSIIQTSSAVPRLWTSGTVYNVFLLHLASGGARPLIDQHAWRAFCHVTGRTTMCEYPLDRSQGLGCYAEYEPWFHSAVTAGLDRRHLNQAMMAFGQFCARFPAVAREHRVRPRL